MVFIFCWHYMLIISVQTGLGLGWVVWQPSDVPPSKFRENSALGEASRHGAGGVHGHIGTRGWAWGKHCGTALRVYQWELRVSLLGGEGWGWGGGRPGHTWPTAPGPQGAWACKEECAPPGVEQYGRVWARTNSVAFKAKNLTRERGSFHNEKRPIYQKSIRILNGCVSWES